MTAAPTMFAAATGRTVARGKKPEVIDDPQADSVIEPQVGIGVVTPFDFALDWELWRWALPGAALYLTRTPYIELHMTLEMAEQVSEKEAIRRATRDVLAADPQVVAYACTSGSFVNGVRGEGELHAAMIGAGAPMACTTSGALVQALDAIGVHNVGVATPYLSSVTDRLHDYLRETGRQVVSSANLGLSTYIWRVPYSQVWDLVHAADDEKAEAIFVSCTNLPTYDLIGPLEQSLGKPVITANQVTVWCALRLLGIRPTASDQRQSLFRLTEEE